MIFPTAEDARSLSEKSLVIFDEIRTIERAVLVAAKAGELETTVDDGTLMTNSTPADLTSQTYFDVWKKTEADRVKFNEMQKVIFYFEARGYSISRETNSNDPTVFQWKIIW